MVTGQAAGAEVGLAALILAQALVLTLYDLGHRVAPWAVPHNVLPSQRLSCLRVTQYSTLNSTEIKMQLRDNISRTMGS